MQSGAGFGAVAIAVLLVVAPVAGVTTVGVAGAQADADIVVDDDGGADYEKLRPALENATDGDTVLVRNGTYRLNYQPVRINETITVRGMPADGRPGTADRAPFVRVLGHDGGPFMKVTPSGSGTVIEGLKVGGRGLSDPTGVQLVGGSVTLRNNKLGTPRFEFDSGEGNDSDSLRLIDNRLSRRGATPERTRDDDIALAFLFGKDGELGRDGALDRLIIRGNSMRYTSAFVGDVRNRVELNQNRIRTNGRDYQRGKTGVYIEGTADRIIARGNDITSTESRSGSGLFINSESRERVKITVENNSITDVDQMGVLVNPGKAQLDADIRENKITDVYIWPFDDERENGVTAGVRIDKDGSGFSDIEISDNEIKRVEDSGSSYGVVVRQGDKQLRVADNVIEGPPIGLQLRSKNRNLTGMVLRNRFSKLDRGISFGKVKPDDAIDLSIQRNRIDRARFGIRFEQKNSGMVADISNNQLSEIQTGVYFNFGAEPFPDGIELHRNNFLATSKFAVYNRNGDPVDARNNYWGAADGPASPTRTLADPVTGALANGTGGNLSENPSTDGVTNVRFDPFLTDPVSISFEEPDPPETPSVPSEERPGGIPRPDFEYVGSATPDAIDRNGTVTVNVTVRNEGEAPGRFDGRLTNGFETLGEQGGQLAPGESTNLSYQVRFDEVSVEQLFVDREYIDEVQVNLPTPEELSRRHLRVDAAYATREVVAPGETFELVAVLNNTDSEAHEFAIEAEAFRTTEPADSATRVLDRRETVLLEGGERRVVRYDVTPEAVDGPRGLTGFVARSNAGNVSVVPASTRPTGVTAAYAARHSETVGVDEHVAVVVQNGNETTETVAMYLEPPGIERDTEAALMEGTMKFVTVAPGETKRVEIPVDRLYADEAPRTWAVNGEGVPVVGADVRETPSPGAVLDEAVENRGTNTTDAAT